LYTTSEDHYFFSNFTPFTVRYANKPMLHVFDSSEKQKVMADKYHQLMKLIVVGDSGGGKSSLLHRFVEDTFSDDQTQTIGVEFGAKIVQLLGRRVKLQV